MKLNTIYAIIWVILSQLLSNNNKHDGDAPIKERKSFFVNYFSGTVNANV